MNDPRHPVQPAPAAPVLPRIPGMPQQQTLRPAAAPVPHAPAHPQARPAIVPAQHAPHAPQQAARPMQAPQPHAPPPPPLPGQSRPIPAPAAAPVDDEAIALEDAGDDDSDFTAAPTTPSKIKFGAELGVKKHAWKRQLKQSGTGACRVRTFHGKLSDQGLEYIDEAINVWLDDHPDVDIKFVTTNVGMFDGKFKDIALIVNVWY
jgi:hypothetical protein